MLKSHMPRTSLSAVIAYACTMSYQCLSSGCCAVRIKNKSLLGFMHKTPQVYSHAMRQLQLTSWSCVNSKTISSTTAEPATILFTGVVLVSSAQIVLKEGVSDVACAMARQRYTAGLHAGLCLQQEQ